ncbi:MAG: hypothetical protein CMH61_00810 [Nanoarchaeota archaeon]|nr:hypothetical protein [Nanoarchaeota archaeon]|tara:strand:+ start:542 stop:2137 length:1596 start_codon:yes stop_codon:yes gene_type:complete
MPETPIVDVSQLVGKVNEESLLMYVKGLLKQGIEDEELLMALGHVSSVAGIGNFIEVTYQAKHSREANAVEESKQVCDLEDQLKTAQEEIKAARAAVKQYREAGRGDEGLREERLAQRQAFDLGIARYLSKEIELPPEPLEGHPETKFLVQTAMTSREGEDTKELVTIPNPKEEASKLVFIAENIHDATVLAFVRATLESDNPVDYFETYKDTILNIPAGNTYDGVMNALDTMLGQFTTIEQRAESSTELKIHLQAAAERMENFESLTQQVIDMETATKKLTRQYEAAREEIVRINTYLQLEQNKSDQLVGQVEETTTQSEELREQLQMRNDELQNAQAQLYIIGEQVVEVTRDLEARSSQYETAERTKQMLNVELSKTSDELAVVSSELEVAVQYLNAANNRIHSLENNQEETERAMERFGNATIEYVKQLGVRYQTTLQEFADLVINAAQQVERADERVDMYLNWLEIQTAENHAREGVYDRRILAAESAQRELTQRQEAATQSISGTLERVGTLLANVRPIDEIVRVN